MITEPADLGSIWGHDLHLENVTFPYRFTGDVMESDKCVVCEQPIRGEDARYVQFYLPVEGIRNQAARMEGKVEIGERVRIHFVNHELARPFARR